MDGDKRSPDGASIAEELGHRFVPVRQRDVQGCRSIHVGSRDVDTHIDEQLSHRLVPSPRRE